MNIRQMERTSYFEKECTFGYITSVRMVQRKYFCGKLLSVDVAYVRTSEQGAQDCTEYCLHSSFLRMTLCFGVASEYVKG